MIADLARSGVRASARHPRAAVLRRRSRLKSRGVPRADSTRARNSSGSTVSVLSVEPSDLSERWVTAYVIR